MNLTLFFRPLRSSSKADIHSCSTWGGCASHDATASTASCCCYPTRTLPWLLRSITIHSSVFSHRSALRVWAALVGHTIVKSPDMTGLSFPTECEIMHLNFTLIDNMMKEEWKTGKVEVWCLLEIGQVYRDSVLYCKIHWSNIRFY